MLNWHGYQVDPWAVSSTCSIEGLDAFDSDWGFDSGLDFDPGLLFD